MNLTTELRPGVDYVGYVDYNVRDFHSYDTRLGATYNAYLIRDEKIALIDTVKAPFAAQLKRNVASLVDLDKVDYLVCLHAELDHAGSLPAMVEACPNATVVCNAKCKDALAGFFDDAGVGVDPGASGLFRQCAGKGGLAAGGHADEYDVALLVQQSFEDCIGWRLAGESFAAGGFVHPRILRHPLRG